jgi:hypothetical protein
MRNPLWLHAGIAAAAAVGGWLAGAASEPSQTNGRIRQTPFTVAGNTLASSSVPAWLTQIASVRSVAGEASEPAWVKWTFSIPDSEIPAAISKLNPHSDFHALRCLYARWVKIDPSAAWASFRGSNIPRESMHFGTFDETDLLAGLTSVRRLEHPRSLIGARMLHSWMAVDPAAARAFAEKLSIPGSAEGKQSGIYAYELDRLTGKTDANYQPKNSQAPSEAAAAALNLPSGDERRSALLSAAARWAGNDPVAAGVWLQQLSAEDRRMLDPESISLAMRAAPPADRAAAITAILQDRTLNGSQFSQAFENRLRPEYHSMGDVRALLAAASAVREWTQSDSGAALKWMQTLPDGDLKSLLAGNAAGTLVASDFAAAVNLVNQTGGDQQFAVKGLMAGWMEKDASAALVWVGKIEDPALRDAGREIAALHFTAIDPALAIETARTITDGAIRQKAYTNVSANLQWNPAALADLRKRFPDAEWKPSR